MAMLRRYFSKKTPLPVDPPAPERPYVDIPLRAIRTESGVILQTQNRAGKWFDGWAIAHCDADPAPSLEAALKARLIQAENQKAGGHA